MEIREKSTGSDTCQYFFLCGSLTVLSYALKISALFLEFQNNMSHLQVIIWQRQLQFLDTSIFNGKFTVYARCTACGLWRKFPPRADSLTLIATARRSPLERWMNGWMINNEWRWFFYINLLLTYLSYYYAKSMFLMSLIWLILVRFLLYHEVLKFWSN